MKNLQLIIVLIFICQPMYALLMINSPEIPKEQKQVVSFTEFVTSPATTQGPVDVGGTNPVSVKWTGQNTNNKASIGNESYYNLGNNGVWNTDSQGYTALNNPTSSVRYTFAKDIDTVGAFMNYLPDNNNHIVLTAYNQSGQVLESYDINHLAPVSTFRGVNQGVFRGIQRTMADIAMFEVSNSYVVLDHLGYGLASPTPEPASLLMTFVGILGSFLLFRKYHR